MRYGMAIDLRRCSGCKACVVMCKTANNLPKKILWNRVLTEGGNTPDTAAGTFPNVYMQHWPINCQHCENPACTRVCPVGATYKDPDNGIVHQDYDKCIGCRMCMAACPYTGVRNFNWEDPQYYSDFAYGDPEVPVHQMHTVEKCTFCSQRLAKGEDPACMENCIGRARHYGDLDDPDSEISRLVASRSHTQLLAEEGTNPSIYYLV